MQNQIDLVTDLDLYSEETIIYIEDVTPLIAKSYISQRSKTRIYNKYKSDTDNFIFPIPSLKFAVTVKSCPGRIGSYARCACIHPNIIIIGINVTIDRNIITDKLIY